MQRVSIFGWLRRAFIVVLAGLLVAVAPDELPVRAPHQKQRGTPDWALVKIRLRGILRVFRFALETYLLGEHMIPPDLQTLVQSPYFPIDPADIKNPYTGKFPDFVSSSGDPSPAYAPGTVVLLSGIRPQIVIMTVYEDRSGNPPARTVLEEVLTFHELGLLAQGAKSPLFPGDTWQDYARMNFIDARLYWRCRYLHRVLLEKGFPEDRSSVKRFRNAVEQWLADEEWFPGPPRRPTDGKPLTYFEQVEGRVPETGSFSVFRAGNEWIPQCYGLMGRPVSRGVEALIHPDESREQKENEATDTKQQKKEGKGHILP
ncbi:MAG: hypothetical protein V2G42_01045 [bacterium JZ-2024 1]